MRTDVLNRIQSRFGKHNPAQVKAGDTIRVHQRITEGDKQRVQIFEGLVIATRHGKGLDGTFTVRKLAAGRIGVERIFPFHSPNIVKVERVKSASVARAKLYYMRERFGKAARFKKETRDYALWDESGKVVTEAPADLEVVDTIAEAEEIPTMEQEIEETPIAPAPEEEVVAEAAPQTEEAEEHKEAEVPKSQTGRQVLGARAEELAAEFLVSKGYIILERNLQIGKDEIDILAEYEDELVVVEVKALRTSRHYDPIDQIDWEKRKHLARLLVTLETRYPDRSLRADAVTLYWVSGVAKPVITHLTDITSF